MLVRMKKGRLEDKVKFVLTINTIIQLFKDYLLLCNCLVHIEIIKFTLRFPHENGELSH